MPMEKIITLNFHDLTPVKRDLVHFVRIKPGEAGGSDTDTADEAAALAEQEERSSKSKKYREVDSVELQQLKELFDEQDTDTCIRQFCTAVNVPLRKAKSSAIYYINNQNNQKGETENPDLFVYKFGAYQVQGYAGVLQVDVKKDTHKTAYDAQLRIHVHSRFDKAPAPADLTKPAPQPKGLFLMYMFEKGAVARGHAYPEMLMKGFRGNSWDLMLAVSFMNELNTAMRKGMFRQYRDYERNDSRLKGRIDIDRHIRENPLFTGRIAYTAREYTVDNPINLLILKAYYHLERKYPQLMHSLTTQYEVVRQGLQILEYEIENWQSVSTQTVLKQTRARIANSVYGSYEPLRVTARAVLTKLGVNIFNQEGSDAISGLLIDLPKLWEEFLYYTVLRTYSGKTGPYNQHHIPMIGSDRNAEPDFLIPRREPEADAYEDLMDEDAEDLTDEDLMDAEADEDWERIDTTSDDAEALETYDMVLDAKYRMSWANTLSPHAKDSNSGWNDVRYDVFQILSYMLVVDCKYGGVIFPISQRDTTPELLEEAVTPVPVSDYCPDRYFARIPYIIPEIRENEQDYRQAFEASDRMLIEFLDQLRNAGDPS